MLNSISIVAITLSLVGCEESNTAKKFSNSSVGNYLSASFAYKNNDYNKAIFYQRKALAKAPNDTSMLKKLYGLMIINGHYDDATILARKHLALEDNAYFAQLLIALDSFRNNKFKEAEKRADIILQSKNQPVSAEVYKIILPNMIAWSHIGQNNYQNAISSLDKITPLRGLTNFSSYQLAIAHELAGNIDIAKDLFDKLTETPYSYKITKAAVDFYTRNNFSEDATRSINAYFEYNPKQFLTNTSSDYFNTDQAVIFEPNKLAKEVMANVLTEVANLLFSTTQFDEAILYYRLALLLNEHDNTARVLLANTLEKKGLLHEALKIYQSIPRTSRLHQSIIQNIAVLHNKMGKHDQAKAILITFSEQNPQRVDALLNLGDILVANKNFNEAIPAYEDALKRLNESEKGIEKKHWPILYALAICYEQNSQWDMSEKTFMRTLAMSPEEPDVLNYLAYSWLTQDTKIDEAAKMLQIAVKKRPHDAHILDSYGWALFKLGKFEESAFFLERANAYIPYDPTTNDHLGDLYWHTDRRTEAIYMWKRALVFKPKDVEITAIKQKIKFGPSRKNTSTKHPKMVKSDYSLQK